MRFLALLVFVLLALTGCDDSARPGAAADSQPGARPEPQLTLTPAELDWVGEQVFNNECSGRRHCLVHWNDGEAFPSLGIGHFIWYPQDVQGRFVESFPSLMAFLIERGADVPAWLRTLRPFAAPWPDKAAFLLAEGSTEVEELRRFLEQTRGLQAEFIYRRAADSLRQIIDAAPQAERAALGSRLQALSATPGGVYALMDYVNFKGEGLAATERYNGEGWGLLQVLLAMSADDQLPALARFRAAAAEVLTRRAENAANPIERERWLPGWLKRLETYREPPRTLAGSSQPPA